VLTYATSSHIVVPQDTEECSCRCVGRCNPAVIQGRSGRRGHTGVLDLEAWLVSSILLVRSRRRQHIRQHRRAELQSWQLCLLPRGYARISSHTTIHREQRRFLSRRPTELCDTEIQDQVTASSLEGAFRMANSHQVYDQSVWGT
jgi:hypothetical protein